MAVYPATYADWIAMGYTGFQADFERWKRDMDVLVAIMDERISSLTSYRRSGVVNVPLHHEREPAQHGLNRWLSCDCG